MLFHCLLTSPALPTLDLESVTFLELELEVPAMGKLETPSVQRLGGY